MPIVQIHLLEGRSDNMKKELISRVTAAVCESLGTQKGQVRVILSEMSETHFAVGGVTIKERKEKEKNALPT